MELGAIMMARMTFFASNISAKPLLHVEGELLGYHKSTTWFVQQKVFFIDILSCFLLFTAQCKAK